MHKEAVLKKDQGGVRHFFLARGLRLHGFAKRMDHGKAPEECGTTALNLHPLLRSKRIIKGYTPIPYNMPWMGTLTRNKQSICSVILLSKYDDDKSSLWAMVASHCIFKEADEQALDEKEVDYKKFGLLFGVHDLRLTTPHVRYRTIQKVYRNFEPSDISLVKLNSPVKFDAYINGLCFPDEPDERDVAEFYMCLTCGWGATKRVTLVPCCSIAPAPKTVATASNELQCIEVKIEQEKPSHVRRKSMLTIQWNDNSIQGPYK
uniref:Peptidase S1 domain-containing protein n=1 Tax=Romanomermis culicivorax TaxID=13658 RepID=A0A915JMH0_ROMCU